MINDQRMLEAFPCDRRGLKILRTDTCDTCNGKGTLFNVYGCEVHGECSLQRRKTKGLHWCTHCEDRESVEDGIVPVPMEQRRGNRRRATPPLKVVREVPIAAPRPPTADPATCTHRVPVWQGHYDRKANPPSLTIKVACRDCGAPWTVDGEPTATLSIEPPPNSPSSVAGEATAGGG